MTLRSCLSVISGALLGVSFPGSGDQSWVAFIALAPLLVAIAGAGWRRAGFYGFISGLVFWLWTIPWLASTLTRYGGVPWPIAAGVVAALATYLALYTAVFCALLATSRRLTGTVGHVVAAGALWVALELVRTHLLTGFPWNLLGYSQYLTPR